MALTGVFDNTTIPNPTTGLFVYNTGLNPGLALKGFMYWNGNQWQYLQNKFTQVGNIFQPLNFLSGKLSPATYVAGTPFKGVLNVYYGGENIQLGNYDQGNPYTLPNGLTLQLQSGTLSNTGTLVYQVTGTPNVSSPNALTFPIVFDNSDYLNKTIGTVTVASDNVFTPPSYYTLKASTVVPMNSTAGSVGGGGAQYGEAGVFLDWSQNGSDASIILPVTGSFAFSITLNGSLDKNGSFPMYISTWISSSGSSLKMQDIAEITATTNSSAGNYDCSYTINLTVSGNAGDVVKIKMSGAISYSRWYLNGGTNSSPGKVCSFVMWQI